MTSTLLRAGACALLLTAASWAGEKKLMHCFAFTQVEGASQADWDAFAKATDALPGKLPGITKVYHGKLMRPLAQFGTDAETRKKLATGEKTATGEVRATPRQYGVCMEMENEAALKAYPSHPEHKTWSDAYAKVRVAGTTTFDIIGQ